MGQVKEEKREAFSGDAGCGGGEDVVALFTLVVVAEEVWLWVWKSAFLFAVCTVV